MNYKVVLIDLPLKCKGFIMPDENDFYTIYINARYNIEQNLKTLLHELSHMNDYQEDNVNLIELKAHRRA